MSLTPFDPQWVGAWWIGILAGMGGFLIVLLPIVGYPKRLPGKKNCHRMNLCHSTECLPKGLKWGLNDRIAILSLSGIVQLPFSYTSVTVQFSVTVHLPFSHLSVTFQLTDWQIRSVCIKK